MSEQVREMFDKIADKYDFLNDLLSFGIHHQWRKKSVALSAVKSGDKVLDCACGTDDFAIAFAKKGALVTATDFVPKMVELADKKFKEKGFDIKSEQADVMNLQFPDNSFDFSSISFGIRNADSLEKSLQELCRVIKPGGKVVVLEFGQPRGLFKYLYKIYSKLVIPIVGRLFSPDKQAYTYLPETASVYPCRENFTNIADSLGIFKHTYWKSLSFGIAYVYILEKK